MILLISWIIMGTLFSGEQLYIAHRAADVTMPENTIESMQRMAQKGALWFEIDVHLMKDGNIAVIHDESLKRTTTGKGKITKKTYHDLHDVFVIGGDGGEKIPMLPDVMEYAYDNGLHVQIEIKGKGSELIRKVDELIARFDCGLFSVYSFEKDVILQFVEKQPKYPLHWNMTKFSEKKFELSKKYGVNMNLDGRFAMKSAIEKIKEAGLKVHIFTVNDEKRAKELFEYGVHAIITDTLIKGENVG